MSEPYKVDTAWGRQGAVRRTRGSVRLAAVVILILNTLRRIFVYDMKPADVAMLVIEIAVLAMIVWGWDISSWRNAKREKEGAQRMQKRLEKGLALLSSGLLLQRRVPRSDDAERIEKWKSQVQDWMLDTHRFLLECSRQAALTFLDDSRQTDAGFLGIASALHQPLRVLNARLANLRVITDRPDLYLWERKYVLRNRRESP